MTQDALLNFLKSLGEKAKAPFARALEDISRDILNRDPEYYDDFYFLEIEYTQTLRNLCLNRSYRGGKEVGEVIEF
jgi:hypothetical protein